MEPPRRSRAGRRGAGNRGQYARAVTPEQLQDVVRTAVSGAVGRGVLAVEVPGRGRRRAPEEPRARRLRHQHRPPAGQGRRPAAARGRRAAGRRAARPGRHREGRRRRARLPQHHPRAGRPRADRRQRRDRGRGLRPHRRARRAEAEPGVRLGQPDRSGAHRRHPLGRRRRRARPAAGGQRRRRHPRVLLQRRRRADRPVRPQPAGRRPGRAGARGRLRGHLHQRHRRPGRRAEPDVLERDDESSCGSSARAASS